MEATGDGWAAGVDAWLYTGVAGFGLCIECTMIRERGRKICIYMLDIRRKDLEQLWRAFFS